MESTSFWVLSLGRVWLWQVLERESASERVRERERESSREREFVGKSERSESWDLRSVSLVLMKDHLVLKVCVWGIESKRE